MPDDPVLQIKVAHAMRVQERNSRRCFTCNRPGHLARDQAPPAEGTSSKQVGPEKAKQNPSQPGQPGPPME